MADLAHSDLWTEAFDDPYAEARASFRSAVQADAYPAEGLGPDGEPLFTDVAWIGPDAPRHVIVLVSGIHGVEGATGSAIQRAWLRANGPRTLSKGAAVMLVHAVNPWGFAWNRRGDENNVDLNRNFVDFHAPLPENPGYEALANSIEKNWDAYRIAGKRLRNQKGEREYQAARAAGQFTHPNGLFFGGTAPSTSRQRLEKIIRDYPLAQAERVVLLDLHTGLGPYGHCTPICHHAAGSIARRSASDWFGPSLVCPTETDAEFIRRHGLSRLAWERALGDRLVAVTAEFGTYDSTSVERVLLEENLRWRDSENMRPDRALLEVFNPTDIIWRKLILFRARLLLDQVLRGLESLDTGHLLGPTTCVSL